MRQFRTCTLLNPLMSTACAPLVETMSRFSKICPEKVATTGPDGVRLEPAVMTWEYADEPALLYVSFPANVAVRLCVPVPRLDVANVATPAPLMVPTPMAIPLSLKMTVPVGTAKPRATTVAVSVTTAPATAGLGDAVNPTETVTQSREFRRRTGLMGWSWW